MAVASKAAWRRVLTDASEDPLPQIDQMTGPSLLIGPGDAIGIQPGLSYGFQPQQMIGCATGLCMAPCSIALANFIRSHEMSNLTRQTAVLRGQHGSQCVFHAIRPCIPR